MVFESIWRALVARLVPATLFCGILLGLAGPVVAQASSPQGGTSLRTVRVDLQAGAFLDPLPFDQAFLIVGKAPATTRLVEARITEYLGEPISPTEGELRRFEVSVSEYLAGTGTTGGLTTQQVRHVRELLVEHVRGDGPRGTFDKLWHYGVPWNWANWADLFREQSLEVVAPETILDGSGSEAAYGVPPSTQTTLAETIAQQARSARIATYSPAREVRPRARWRRLGEGGVEAEVGAAADGNFNQLARIHAMTGSPDADLFASAAQSQGPSGEGRGWRSFEILVDPLTAQRHYHFRFHLQRDPTEAEVEAFLGRARRRGDGVLAETGRGTLSLSEGERLRHILIESLGAASGGAVSASGGVLSRSTPYATVHEQTVRLVELWRIAADSGSPEVLEAELRDLAREQRLVEETGADAATADNGYVSVDLGLLYAPTIGRTVATVGANFYLRPVDKAVAVSQTGGLGRFAFTVGVTLNSIEDRRRIRSDFYFNQALILGAGYRISQYWRIGAGGLVFRERDPDSYPLTRRKRTALTPYVALTADMDAGRQLKGIGGLLDFLKGGQ